MPHPVALNDAALPEGVHDMGSFNRTHIRLTAHNTSQAAKPAVIDTAPGVAIPPSQAVPASGEIDNATRYHLINAIGSPTLEDGKYLLDPATGKLEIQWIQGIGSEKAAAPQGRLMATVINGILSRKLPWSLVLLGVALVIAVELLGVRSLTFAVGAYLSIATTLAIFAGGLVRWMADRAVLKARARDAAKREAAVIARRIAAVSPPGTAVAVFPGDTHVPFAPPHTLDELEGDLTGNEALTDLDNDEVSPGSLFASGLIAAGGIVGLLGVAIRLYESATDRNMPRFSEHNLLHHDPVSVLMFVLLAGSLFYFARAPLDSKDDSK